MSEIPGTTEGISDMVMKFGTKIREEMKQELREILESGDCYPLTLEWTSKRN